MLKKLKFLVLSQIFVLTILFNTNPAFALTNEEWEGRERYLVNQVDSLEDAIEKINKLTRKLLSKYQNSTATYLDIKEIAKVIDDVSLIGYESYIDLKIDNSDGNGVTTKPGLKNYVIKANKVRDCQASARYWSNNTWTETFVNGWSGPIDETRFRGQINLPSSRDRMVFQVVCKQDIGKSELADGVEFKFSKVRNPDNPPRSTNPPIADAGLDRIIYLPTNSATPEDPSITNSEYTTVKYVWTLRERDEGTSIPVIKDGASLTPTFSSLSAGNYIFRLTVTDNLGRSDTDDMKVTVRSSGLKTTFDVDEGARVFLKIKYSVVGLNDGDMIEVIPSVKNFLEGESSVELKKAYKFNLNHYPTKEQVIGASSDKSYKFKALENGSITIGSCFTDCPNSVPDMSFRLEYTINLLNKNGEVIKSFKYSYLPGKG